jgi:A-macroglobulin complement component/carboxypeptidase family protein/alpha-2-macroglobulin family protein
MKAITICALLGSQLAYAGTTGGVEGTIMDETGKVMSAGGMTVDIACGKLRRSARVDSSGHFTLSGLPAGNCTLTTDGAKYIAATLGVTISADAIATLIVNVQSKAYAEQQKKLMLEYRKRARYKVYAPSRAMGRGGGGGGVAIQADDFAGGVEGGMPPAAMPPPPPPRPAKKDVAAKAPVAAKNNERVQQQKPVGNAGPAMPQQAVKLEDARWAGKAGKKQKLAENRAMEQNAQQVQGWALVRVFPVPEYPKRYDGPRTDFRETVYWNAAVETNGNGDADVSFVASDAVTAFRATAEGFAAGGLAGGGQATFASKLPLTLDAHLPVEVTAGDTIQLPVTVANETGDAIDATLGATFGAAFKLVGEPARNKLALAPNSKQTVVFPLQVTATDGSGDVALKLAGRGLTDEVAKTIRVVPRGFPIEVSAAGTATKGETARHVLDLAGAMPGTIHASVTMYPSPVALIASGMDGMIREPGGCFEQASSTNYPNVMIMGYLQMAKDGADPALVEKTQGTLAKGYKLLSGYETPEKGYEWFGHTPGHEALTAYGLMEFADMAKVYDVDRNMVQRTADWLMARRDGAGGFQRSSQALDSFGRAGPATTNAYIMWALAEAHRTGGMTKELAAQKQLGSETKDPYLLALAANTNLVAAPGAPDTGAMVKRLAQMQGKDGSFAGAKETITMSGGESLVIETTALATLAMLKASPKNEYEPQIRQSVEWINGKRGGWGAWGNTQATILGLKALTAYQDHARQMQSPGRATLIINGKEAGTISFDKGRREALVWDKIADKLAPGKNTVELKLDGAVPLPYAIAVEYRSASPASSPRTKLAVTTQLLKTSAKMGEGVTLRAHVENTTAAGIPMTLARVGLPGGTVFQTWQLKELRDKGVIDFYETRPREVILYWRALPPNARKDVDINLLAAVPGTYEAPASSAYLYYTAEDKAWTKPVAITIDK